MDLDNIPRLDPNLTLTVFEKFLEVEVVDEHLKDIVIESGDEIWKFLVGFWNVCAREEGRSIIEVCDIIVYMIKKHLMKDYNEFSALIRNYLPLELQTEVLDMAQAQEKISERASRKKHYGQKSKNLSAGQIYARRKLFSYAY